MAEQCFDRLNTIKTIKSYRKSLVLNNEIHENYVSKIDSAD